MERVRVRSAVIQSSLAGIALLGAPIAIAACSPSSGTAPSDGLGQGNSPGGFMQANGGRVGAGGGSAGLPPGQGGVVGGGGIVAQAGAGGFDPGTGGVAGSAAVPGTGGFVPSTGGAPGGACGTNTVDPSPYPACTTCTGGRCVPDSSLPQNELNLLGQCDSTSHCVHEQIVTQAENVYLRPCTSIGGSEGRCTSL